MNNLEFSTDIRGMALRLLKQKHAMKNVFSINAAREIKDQENSELEYRAKILTMDKLELLEEMVRFQEERSASGSLNLSMMVRGKHLFLALEQNAETKELRSLTRSYRRHLELELQEYSRKLTTA